jgi:hypothetical protein
VPVTVTVTYELTDLGASLHDLMRGIKGWAEGPMDQVLANRERYDAPHSGAPAVPAESGSGPSLAAIGPAVRAAGVISVRKSEGARSDCSLRSRRSTRVASRGAVASTPASDHASDRPPGPLGGGR